MNGWNTSDTPRRISGRRIASVCGLVALVGGAVGLRASGAALDSVRAESLGARIVGVLREGAAHVAAALQPEKVDQPGIWEFERDFGKPKAASGSHVTMIQQNGDRTVEVHIVDGEASAKVNGKKVKKDRIVREGSAVRITDDDGNVIAEFHVAEPGDLPLMSPRLRSHELLLSPQGPGRVPQAFALASQPPKVMIGVTMSDADAEVAEQLGVPGGVRLDHVYEDLPADDAGLRAGDIVIVFDGEENPSTEGIRDALRSKDPGDSVDVVVLRKGKKIEASIELGEYDAARLGQTPAGVTTIPGIAAWNMSGQTNDEAKRAIEEALKSLQMGGHEEARTALAEALKQLEGVGEGHSIWLGQGGDVFAVEPDGAFEDRMADLDRRLTELDERMEQLDRRLQRVLEAMERTRERGGR